MRNLGGQRERDRPAAGAEVDRDRGGGGRCRERVDRQLGDHLGLGPRDEHARADPQLEMAERRGPGEVLEGFARRAPGDERVEPGRIRCGEQIAAHGGGLDGSASDAQHVRGEELGIHACVGDPRRGQAVDDAAQGVGEGDGGRGGVSHERHPA